MTFKEAQVLERGCANYIGDSLAAQRAIVTLDLT